MMKKFLASLAILVALAFSGIVNAQPAPSPMVPNGAYTAPQLIANQTSFTADSRTIGMLVSVACNGDAPLNCGTSGTNWYPQASALSGGRYAIGNNVAGSGCRSDQYLAWSNISTILNDNSQWLMIGPPAINDLGAQVGNGSISANVCSNSGGSFPYTNNNGVSVDLSNVASVVAGNIAAVIPVALQKGKKIILTEEPGNTAMNNTAQTVSSFNGQLATTVLTVNSMTSGRVAVNQTLSGSGITSGTIIVGSALQNPSLCSPACTGLGGAGTYAVNISQTVAAEAITGVYSPIAALFELNANLRSLAAAYPGQVYLWSANAALWNPTGSATGISFKTGVLLDGSTHYSVLGGYLMGVSFNNMFQTIFPSNDTQLAAINNVGTDTPTNVSNPRQLINNPLFQTATGGTNVTCTLSSGTVPSGWQENCGSAGTSVTITQGADANGYGNSVQLAITSTGADTYTFRNALASNNVWNLTDYMSGAFTVSVANASSHCTVYADNQVATDVGTRDTYALYGGQTPTGGGVNDGPTTAYSYLLQTPPALARSGSASKTFMSFRLVVQFSAAGSCTVTVSRASLNRATTYNPVTGLFSGWLLMRDIGGAANDNSPVGLLKAG